MKARPLAVRTLFIIAARHGVQKLVVDAHAVRLFVVLSLPKRAQGVGGLSRAAGVQRVPTVLFWSGDDLPADDRPNGLLRVLALQHRGGFRPTDFPRRGCRPDTL